MPERNNEYVYQPPAKFTEELRQRINNAGFSDEFKQQIKSAQKEEVSKMYERLTKRNSNGDVASHVDPRKRYMLFVNRLAAYEDSGLSPQEVQKMARAKADGRLVVLPCKEVYTKAGDTLYLIDGGEIIEVTHCGAEISPSGEIYVVVAAKDKIFPFRQPDPENDLDPTDWCTETKEVMLDDFGKTVFLTREEAEKALGGGQDV